jgi:hypothetical protein
MESADLFEIHRTEVSVEDERIALWLRETRSMTSTVQAARPTTHTDRQADRARRSSRPTEHADRHAAGNTRDRPMTDGTS